MTRRRGLKSTRWIGKATGIKDSLIGGQSFTPVPRYIFIDIINVFVSVGDC